MNIFLIDDSISMIFAFERAINSIADCQIYSFQEPLKALEKLESMAPDLVLVDYEMPTMNGIEVIKSIRANEGTATVPVIMITSTTDKSIKLTAIEAGATEFLHKPFDDTELRIRVQNLLNIRSAQLELTEQAADLNRKYEDAMARINRREEEIIWRLSKAIGIRDGDTGNHIDRVSYIAGMIAEELGLDQEVCRMIFLASPLHDVGKLGVPDSILLKPGKLTAEEFGVMQQHTELGAQILGGSSSKLIQVAETIAANHHEKWDGTGYPKGLKGNDIPIEARIVAIADVLDALCSDRPYKNAWPLDAAFAEVLNASGKHFDPVCVAAFCRRWPEIRQTFSTSQKADVDNVTEFNVGKTA
ncbi:HD-GYP domain-containing protein [Rhizobium sp. C4]|uniref:HD-GYP domain-containing protein n=1 Tax=Rhizobium sp. C4 TaxID=1349800 RepID=UPI001E33116A|nr:HD domain-containing phosphohydrolase [Rhizobium sp. C4]MCD2172416.1 response regulator [Rhizobium sp. C4]